MLIVGLTACGGEQDEESPQSATANDPVSRQIAADFALLRTAPDGIPPAIRRILKAPVTGMDWSLARRVPVALPGAYWLAPGVKHLCVVATTPDSPAVGTVCATYDQALRHGVANASLDPVSDRRIIVGVAPDGTRSVLIRSRTSTASVPVRAGSFVLRDSVPFPPDQLTLR